MKKFFTAVFTALIIFSEPFPIYAAVSENPTVVLMKFTDDTRYDAINSAEILSELVLDKMVASKKFNLKELEPLKEDIEARLYDEKVDELTKFNAAISSNDYNELFEGNGFKENKAQTIATAQVGQFVTPEITSTIGENHNAEYLVQGTIINLGTGSWMNENLEFISSAVNQIAQVATSQAANLLGSSLNFLGGGVSFTVKGIGVQCDVRIIKASTGEVVWSKRVLGKGESSDVTVAFITFTHSNFGSKLYNKAMNNAAEKIVNALVADMEANKLFMK